VTWPKYALVAAALVSWFAKLSLFYISDVAGWFWYLSLCCWFLLFVLAAIALVRFRPTEFVIFSVTLLLTFSPALNIGAKPIEWLQESVFRMHALHRINSASLEEFLSSCVLTEYSENDGTKHRIGQCDEGFRTNSWPQLSLIYDPTGQAGLPGYRRTVAWRLAAEAGFQGGTLVKSSDMGEHLTGNFYFVRISPEGF
jgi:hypothetical protein